MWPIMRGLYLFVVVAAVSSGAAFQNSDLPATFRSTTRLIQVNVVATEKNGKPVTDLRKEDFVLFEDGQPQRIVVFVPEKAKLSAQPARGRNEFGNHVATTNSSRAGYSLILLDLQNSSPATRMSSKQEVLKLLKKIEVHDLVSLCILDRGLSVLADFTADRAELAKRVASAYSASTDAPSEDPTALSSADGMDLSPVDLSVSGMNRFLGKNRILGTFDAFEQIANYLGSVPGRKSLVWVTSGFPSAIGYDVPEGFDYNSLEAWDRYVRTERRTFSTEMDSAVRRLNNSDIAVYSVDARGLVVGKGGRINIAAMAELSARTGGRAYYDRNDMDNEIRSALDDLQVSYTLGYYPTNSDNDGKYRNIRVAIERPGVAARFRTGYEAADSHKIDALQRALASPLDVTSLPLKAQAVKAGGQLDLRLKIDPSMLTLREENGRKKGRVSVFYTFRLDDGSGKAQIYSLSNNLDVPQSIYPKLLQQGLTFRKQIPIPVKATSLRIVLRDEESALIGSVTIQLSAVR